MPDVLILYKIANLFGITVNDLLSSPNETPKTVSTQKKKINSLVITLLAIGLVWLVATAVFVIFNMFDIVKDKVWLAYSIGCVVIATIFNSTIR